MAALFLRPDADQSDGSWLNESSSNTNLFASVDEATTPSDSDYIQSSSTLGDKVRLRLSDPGTIVSSPMIVRYRAKRGSGSATAGVTGRLFQGTTQIATWLQAIDDTLTTYTYTLTSPEFSSISDFNDLFVEFEYSSIWWLSGAAVDLWLATAQYYDSSAGGPGQAIATYMSCVRASSGAFATNADGTLTSFGTDTLRIGIGTGLLIEDARTNVVLWNRDLTNAAWTQTNITAALDQTGVDGTANSASSILATAANGTVLQTTTVGSSARWQSAYVKRITGSGTVNMTMDNGSTWTAITVTSSWTRVAIPTQTLANPTVGFRLVTNGDKIAVDLVQNENSDTFASSPISTTTSALARAADSVTFASTLFSLIDVENRAVVVDFISNGFVGGTLYIVLNSQEGPGRNNFIYFIFDDEMRTDSFTDSTTIYHPSLPGSVLVGSKFGVNWNASGFGNCGNGSSVSTTTGSLAGPNTRIGMFENQAFGYYRRITVWDSKLADATLQAFTV